MTIDVFTNDQGGADGTLVSTVAVVAGSLTGTGVLLNNGNGTFTYTPGVGEQGVVTFQYTITDRDGDPSTATATITLLADSTPQVVNVVAAVDDDALGGNAASTTGDIDANAGESPLSASEATYNGQITVNFGGDTGTVSFANLHGTSGTVGTETVNYSWNGGTNTLTATGPRGVLFTVSLTPSGAYTVNLVDNVLHAAGGNETSAPVVNLNYRATDSDGDSNTTGILAVTFNDDAPTLGVVQNQQISNTPADPTATGTLHFVAGADGAGTAMTIGANMTGITSGGRAIFTQQVGNVLTGYADTDSSGGVSVGDTAVFTLTVNPTAGTSGQYVFDLLAPLDGNTVNVSVGSGSSFGVGPSNSVIVGDTATATQLALVTGWEPTGGFTPAELSAWQAGGIPTMTQRADINGSTAGWGLANNNFDAGEFLRFDFGVLNDYDGPGGYTPPVAGPFANISYASFSFANWGATDSIIFVVHYTNNTTATFTRNAATHPSTFTINSPPGTQIAWIDTYMSSGSIKLDLTDLGVTSTVVDRTIPFTLQLTDGDGDTTTTAAFTVRVGNGLVPSAPAPQEVLKWGAAEAEALTYGDAQNDNDATGVGTTSAATAQAQLREQGQSNALVAASLVALAGADMAIQDSPLQVVHEEVRLAANNIEFGVADNVPQFDITQAVPAEFEAFDRLEIDTAEFAVQSDMPTTQAWGSNGIDVQDMPVDRPLFEAFGDTALQTDMGTSLLAPNVEAGMIDALLLVRQGAVEAGEQVTTSLQEVVADTFSERAVDTILDHLTSPVGESLASAGHGLLADAGDNLAAMLIDMPVSNDIVSHISTVSLTDHLQEMASTQA